MEEQKPRGAFEHSNNGEVVVVKWKDNQVVSIASTVHGIESASLTGRYSRQERKRIQVLIPRIVLEYNKFIGGLTK